MSKRYKLTGAILMLAILLVGTVAFVSAQTTNTQDIYNQMSFSIAKIQYALTKGLFIFTSWGQQNGCSVNPDWEGWIRGFKSQPSGLPNSVSCSKVDSTKCAIDVWYDNTIYLNNPAGGGPPSSVDWNNWLREVTGNSVSFSSTDRPYYYVQVYSCPAVAPISTTHKTSAYVCNQQGTFYYEGKFGQDQACSFDTSGTNRCWCSDENDKFYVDQNGGVHCRSSPSSDWCVVPTQPTPPSNNPPPSSPSVTCNSGADIDGSGNVDLTELQNYISKWVQGSITRNQLGTAIQEWANGCSQ